jgi:hypothetical protein
MVNLRNIESGKVRATEDSPARRHCRNSRFPPIVKYVMQAKTTTPMLGRAGDAPAHRVDLALVGAAEGVLALYLRRERHAPALPVESVFTFAPRHGADARAVTTDASACIRHPSRKADIREW